MLKTHLLPIILVGFLFFIAQSINHTLKKPLLVISRDDSALNFHNDFLTLFSLGQRRMISSILWIHTLLQSDHKHYKKKNLNSWMYLRFRTIAHIDPEFYQNYLFGGQYLSVIKDDLLGASEIYRLGLMKFEDDFWLNFHGAFHYYFEMKDIDRALAHYEKIQYHPIAQNKMRFIPSLIARIKAKRGNLENAFFLLKKTYDNTPKSSPFKKAFHSSLYRVKAEMDLHCLNKLKRKDCGRKDFAGDRYVLGEEGVYRAVKKWDLFRPHD